MNTNLTPINPIAFELCPISVHWYGVISGLGALLGLYIATQECKKRGVSPLVFTLPIAIISARAYYVLFEWGYFKNHLNEISANGMEE